VLGVFIILLISNAAIYGLDTQALPSNISIGTPSDIPHSEFSLIEFSEHLINIIVLVDLMILFIATIFSYFFARRTLQPIETIYRQQEQFVGDVAHELRTPLAVLKAGSEAILLKEHHSTEYISFIKELEEETDRLTRLSNELLFILKQSVNQTPQFSTVDLNQLVAEQVKFFQPYAEERNITLMSNTHINGLISGVPNNLVQLIQNLLKNAIDYNQAQGTVTISLTETDQTINLLVQDTGVGIAPEDQAKIFNRFYKTDSSRSQSGTGLGLSIVDSIVKAHQGKISISSTLGAGTTITVSFPRYTSS